MSTAANTRTPASTRPGAETVPTRRVPLLNIEVDDLDMDELLACFDEGLLVTPNVDHLMLLQHDCELMSAYQSARFVTVDSQVLYFAMRWLGRPVKAKLSGSDILPAFCWHHAARARAGSPSARLFLLGGEPGVATGAQAAINDRVGFPLVVGALSPSMRFVDDESEIQAAIDAIRSSGADTLAVGLGAPKQEIWIQRHRDRVPGVRRFLAIGGALAFEAGTMTRAPHWMSASGLEWLHRLSREPQRLWRRYLLRDVAFFKLLLRERLGRYRNPLARE